MNFKIFTLAVFLLTPGLKGMAQNNDLDKNRHAVNISYSDGLTLGGASFWGMGLADAITGTTRSNEQSTGVFGLGYRYSLSKRMKLGMDIGFAKVSSHVTAKGDKGPSYKEKELNLLVLPTAEVIYLKRNLFQLYGSAAAGINLTRHSETAKTEKGKELVQAGSHFNQEFAYQVNPIGVRFGNKRIGGFVEAGLGYRGFITAGISLGF